MGLALILALASTDVRTGPWRAWLDSPGGELPFELQIHARDGKLTAAVINGAERIDVPETRVEGREIAFLFPHYDAVLRATIAADGARLDGEWTKRKGPDARARLPFHATAGTRARFRDSRPLADRAGGDRESQALCGRLPIRFESRPESALLVVECGASETTGTVLTPTGDFRYLAGGVVDGALWLSGFDGAHAFLLRARATAAGPSGDFWSGDAWHETFGAASPSDPGLADPLALTRFDDSFGLALLEYPDLAGNLVSLGDPAFAGRARVLQIAGSWCPNCQDETRDLAELERKYAKQPVSIVALCFEVSGERDRDAELARRMLERHGATYRALLAGPSDKRASREALPALDRVFAFPTTVFVRKDGTVRAVHTGYSGPATGAAHARLKRQFETLVDELLAEPAPDTGPVERVLLGDPWRDERDRNLITFERQPDGLHATATEMTRFDGPTKTEPVAAGSVSIAGNAVTFLGTTWHYDARAKVLLDPRDYGRRLTPGVRWPFPVIDGVGRSELQEIVEGTTSTDALVRRECAYYLARQVAMSPYLPPEEGGGTVDAALAVKLLPLVSDPDAIVRATASWAAGFLHLEPARDALIGNLAHGFAPVRRESARALASLAARDAEPALTARAYDLDPLVRAAVVEALARLRAPSPR